MLGVCVCVHVRVPNAVFFLLLSWVLMFSLVAFPSVHLLHSLKHFSISRYSLGGGCNSFYEYTIAGVSWCHKVSQSEVDHSVYKTCPSV